MILCMFLGEMVSQHLVSCRYDFYHIVSWNFLEKETSDWEAVLFPSPEIRESPEFGVFQEIAQKIAQKILCYFKIGQKRPKKLPNDTKTLKKLPK